MNIKGGEGFKKALAEIAGKLEKGATLRVGFLEGATYPPRALKGRQPITAKQKRMIFARSREAGAIKKGAARGGGASPLNVAAVAAIQEFGAPRAGIPPRPFFRNMIAKHEDEWPKSLAANLKATNYDVDKSMKLLGEEIKGQLQQSIVDTNSPPLKESTIRRKGHSKPLVESGHMLNSVDYETKD